jgi:hypothetical protein
MISMTFLSSLCSPIVLYIFIFVYIFMREEII